MAAQASGICALSSLSSTRRSECLTAKYLEKANLTTRGAKLARRLCGKNLTISSAKAGAIRVVKPLEGAGFDGEGVRAKPDGWPEESRNADATGLVEDRGDDAGQPLKNANHGPNTPSPRRRCAVKVSRYLGKQVKIACPKPMSALHASGTAKRACFGAKRLIIRGRPSTDCFCPRKADRGAARYACSTATTPATAFSAPASAPVTA